MAGPGQSERQVRAASPDGVTTVGFADLDDAPLDRTRIGWAAIASLGDYLDAGSIVAGGAVRNHSAASLRGGLRCWGRPGVTVEEPDEGVEGSYVVLAGGGQVAADPGEACGAGLGLEAGGDLPVQLHGPQVAFGLVVGLMPISA